MNRVRGWTKALLVGVLVVGGVVSAPVAAATAQPAPGGGAAHSASTPSDANACPTVPPPGHYTCYALRSNNNAGSRSPDLPGDPYTPADLRSAYNLTTAATAGGGQRIYVVDAYGYPNAEADLAQYRSHYGLAPCTTANGCFRKLNQNGAAGPYPAFNAGWAEESALDLDMVSAICPKCGITLIESDDDSDNLFLGVQRATTLGAKYVSMSWGGAENGNEAFYDANYLNKTAVVYTASSGDGGYGAGASFPSTSKNVVAVGGTSLSRTATGRRWTEHVWHNNPDSATGSACSSDEPKPAWQRIVAGSVCARRAGNDIAAVADPNPGVAVYVEGGFHAYGGTSASAPIIAAIYALAGTPASGSHPGAYPYARDSALYDVTAGNNGACSPALLCTAAAGWDGPTGLGTPNGLAAFRAPTSAVTVINPDDKLSSLGGSVYVPVRASEVGVTGTLTFGASGLPPGLTITSAGAISGAGTTLGNFRVKVTATDTAHGVHSSAYFTWSIARAGTLVPVPSARILDTRTGLGAPVGKVPTNGSVPVQVLGRGGVPLTGVSSVVLNVTATAPSAQGYLTVYADGTSKPLASSLNYSNFTVPQLVVAPVGSDGKVRLAVSGSVHLIADVAGYHVAGRSTVSGAFVPLTPTRLLDTRNGTGGSSGPVLSGRKVVLPVRGVGGVPATGVAAVALTVTATNASSDGYVTAFQGGTPPGVSTLNFSAGVTVPNLAMVPVASDGTVSLYVFGGGGIDLVADVYGYYLSGSPAGAATVPGSLTALSPVRVLDTRNGTGTSAGPGRVSDGNTATVDVAASCGMGPASNVSAVLLNTTVTVPTGGGYVTVYPDAETIPDTSNLNYRAGQTVANLVLVPISPLGVVDLTVVGGSTHLVADLVGCYHS